VQRHTGVKIEIILPDSEGLLGGRGRQNIVSSTSAIESHGRVVL
jgi:hypothetical protein